MVATTGASGKMSCQGFVIIDNGGVALTAGIVNTGTTTTGQITVNTQTAQVLGISATFSIANSGNIITMTQLVIEEKS